MEESFIAGNGEFLKGKIVSAGTASVDFDKQIIKFELKRCETVKELTCDEAYHLWSILNNIFKTKDIADKIKVYNLSGEEITLNNK